MIPLLNTQSRQPHMVETLARVLTAVSIAVKNLIDRIVAAEPAGTVTMPYTCKEEWVLSRWQDQYKQQSQQVQAALQPFAAPGVQLEAWLKAVQLSEQQLQHAAAIRGDDDRAWPYCLWAVPNEAVKQVSGIKQLQLLPGMCSNSLLFSGL